MEGRAGKKGSIMRRKIGKGEVGWVIGGRGRCRYCKKMENNVSYHEAHICSKRPACTPAKPRPKKVEAKKPSCVGSFATALVGELRKSEKRWAKEELGDKMTNDTVAVVLMAVRHSVERTLEGMKSK